MRLGLGNRIVLGVFGVLCPIVLWSQNDSISNTVSEKSKLKQRLLSISGTVGLGYDYGLLPFISDAAPPQGNFVADGYLNVSIKNIPIGASYYYSSVGTISGLNNYFRFHFDAQKYKQELKEKLLKKKGAKLEQLKDVEGYKQKVLKQLNYLEMIKQGKIKPKGLDAASLPNISSLININSIPGLGGLPLDQQSLSIAAQDSLTGLLPDTDDLKDSLSQFTDEVDNYKQEVQGRITTLKNVLAKVEKIQSSLNKYKNMDVNDMYNDPEMVKGAPGYQSRLSKVLAYTQKLEVGLCYPNHSFFTIARTPLRGFNFEYQKGKKFLAFTHGRTINNLLYSTNLVQNNLSTVRNLYNFFDFRNVDASRRITAVKFGYGEKLGTHVYVGLMHGYGKTSYLDSTSSAKEHNVVAEIDVQWKLDKRQLLSLCYGRSYLQANNVNFDGESQKINGFFDLGERTNAAMLSYELDLPKQRSELTAKLRYVDPFFRSLGLGYLRADNLRYELKYKQRIGRKFKLGGFIRHEQDNLLKLYDYQNQLFSFGLTADAKPTKGMLLRLDLRPIVHNFNADQDSISGSNRNWIANFVTSYRRRIKKHSYFDITGVYGYYQLFNGEDNNTYQNINVTANLQVKEKWTFAASYGQFISSDTAVIPINNLLGIETGVQLNKISLTGSGKMAIANQPGEDVQFGYGVHAKIKVIKRARLELTAERLVIGDFYNSLLITNVEDFPYYFNTTIRITI